MSTPGRNEQAIRDLYADEDTEDNVWFGHALEDAQEQDRVNALWSQRADDEAAQLGRLEDPEL